MFNKPNKVRAEPTLQQIPRPMRVHRWLHQRLKQQLFTNVQLKPIQKIRPNQQAMRLHEGIHFGR
jgi:hypothetical protein